MYSIGEISKIVNISIDTLRYYDQIGLLKPYHVDDKTRYRYFSEQQIRELIFIIEMKQYGLSLDAIRELLANGDVSRVRSALIRRAEELQDEMDRQLKLHKRLQERIMIIHEEDRCMTMKPTVLIVDDSAFMRKILGEILANHGYELVGEAATGEEGIKQYAKLRPNLVILDIHMPEGLDGFEAAKQMKAIDSSANIVMCSAKGQVENVLTSFLSGARAFIVKPFQSESMLDALSDVLTQDRHLQITTISKWLSDEKLLSSLPKEPLSQHLIDQMIHIFNAEEAPTLTDLYNILAEL